MTLQEFWTDVIHSAERLGVIRNAKTAVFFFLALIISLCVMLGVTIILRRFFKRHVLITRTHKVLIYMLTMSGVAALLFAGILGLVLPIIPGIPLLLAGLLLMRRYHRFGLVERVLLWLRKKAHKVRKKVHAHVQAKVNIYRARHKNLGEQHDGTHKGKLQPSDRQRKRDR